MSTEPNPFNITKAVDFSDQEIHDYWVDITEGAGFSDVVKPTSAMPMLILGGKGSGKTHLMRHFSYALQRIRHPENLIDGIKSDGYLGIYLRCGGLNAARFSGKGQPDDTWVEVFAYHFELWLGQLLLTTVIDLRADCDDLATEEPPTCQELAALFDVPGTGSATSFASIRDHLGELQRSLDTAVNNCAITRKLDVKIALSRGSLIFGMPRILAAHLGPLRDTLFVYLVDEFENLTEAQQKYVNTLIREKQRPCTFKIGARLYGVREYGTYSADEDNKEGSEYETLRLDAWLRSKEQQYRSFARRLIVKRLSEHSYTPVGEGSEQSMAESLGELFDTPPTSDLAREETAHIPDKYQGRERPYFRSLSDKLQVGVRAGVAPGITTEDEIGTIMDRLRCAELPLLEKANIFLLYKSWHSRNDLVEAAASIAEDCQHYADGERRGRYTDTLLHFKADLLAQLSRDCGPKQRYRGIESLIDMSWGLPRNLLILLKCIFSWAAFYGEEPFRDKPISARAQDKGVGEAAEWFFRDARMTGRDGQNIQDAINRLGTLLRSIRFSDKPAECSCSAFSCDLSRVSAEARKYVDLAQKWSLLIDVGDQYDRNTKRRDLKFQLNRMLAPRWGIAFYRRGVLALSPEEVNAIFDPAQAGRFDEVLRLRVDRMTAPFFGRKPTSSPPKSQKKSQNAYLPGFDDE